MDTKKELLFNKLSKISPIGIQILDVKERKLICANNWTTEHMGYSKDEFTKLSKDLFAEIIHPDDRKIQLQSHQLVVTNPDISFHEFIVRVKKKDGDYAHACVRLTILETDSNNMPKTILSITTDVTEMVSLREQLDRELKKIDLISYKNSHELRGPVATLLGLIQLIDHTSLDGSRSSEFISYLKETVIKLDMVIHEINQHTS